MKRSLPEELRRIVSDKMCRRRSNNKTSDNHLVRVQVDGCPFTSFKLVETWLLSRVATAGLNVVAGVTNTQQLIFALNFGGGDCPFKHHSLDSDGLIVTEERTDRATANADDVLKRLDREPSIVRAIGVSGVSADLMSKTWADIVQYGETMIHTPEGFLRHPMWVHVAGFWRQRKENSFDFGWKNYYTPYLDPPYLPAHVHV